MSVPAMLSNPGLAISGACFDLDDLQAMVEDYENRIAEERTRREKAEAHLADCLGKIEALEQEVAKVKSLVVGTLVKVQGAPVAPAPVAPPPTQAARVPPAPAPTRAAPPPTQAARVPPAPAPTRAAPPATAPAAVQAGKVPFSPPRVTAPTTTPSTPTARTPAPAADHGGKPKRRIMRSRRG